MGTNFHETGQIRVSEIFTTLIFTILIFTIGESGTRRLASSTAKATLIVSHFPPASFCRTACFRLLFDHVTKIFIIAIS